MSLITETEFCLQRWAGCLPSVETDAEWSEWAQGMRHPAERDLEVRFIPAGLRRRLSLLGKMCLVCAHKVVEPNEQLPIVFCSRHGELSRVSGLLEAICQHEPLSPSQFSMSVHNSTVGLYSIINNNHACISAIAASDHSFESGLIEALAILHTQPTNKVALFIAEESPTPYFRDMLPAGCSKFALALILSQQEGQRVSCKFTDHVDPRSETQKAQAQPNSLIWLRWLLNSEQALKTYSSLGTTFWQKC